MSTVEYTSNNYGGRQLRVKVTQTQNIAANTSTLNWTLYSEGGSVNYYSIYGVDLQINYTSVYRVGEVSAESQTFPAAKGSTSGAITIKHNADGTCPKINVYFRTGVYNSASVKDYGGFMTLDSIPRQANILTAPNFTDADSPKITYSNPAGNSVDVLQTCIADGWTAVVPYRALTKTGTEYTYNFTDAEKEALYDLIPNASTKTLNFFVTTVIGDTYYYSKLSKTFTISGGEPTISSIDCYDNNSTTVALTGDNTKIIKYFSNVYFNINATANKKATLNNQSYYSVNGTNKSYAKSAIFSNVENNKFEFSVTDSRAKTSSQTKTLTMINYVKLTLNSAVNINVDGEATINFKGNYFNDSFGAQNNTLTLKYKYKESGGTFSDWQTVTASASGNAYNVTATLSGLDYRKNYIFVLQAADKLITKTSSEINTKALPVFDWGKDDFNFNVPVKLAKGAFINPNFDNSCLFINARDNSIVRQTEAPTNSGFTPIISMKTDNGVWSIGIYGEGLVFSYTTDANYQSGTNSHKFYKMTPTGSSKEL